MTRSELEASKSGIGVAGGSGFLGRLQAKAQQQLASNRVGFLLGAGTSYLAGRGYPLAAGLWPAIRELVPATERADIESKICAGAAGIEAALDLLDSGGAIEPPHRSAVTNAIAEAFAGISPPLDDHRRFVRGICRRPEYTVPVFTLNYDLLVEQAAETERAVLVDGFSGFEHRYFDPIRFQQRAGVPAGPKQIQTWQKGVLLLFKLHGSLNWFHSDLASFAQPPRYPLPQSARRLMIPPQYRKAADSTAQPYAALWSEFRRVLCQGPGMLNRLFVLGYGMADEHVNVILENALVRPDFTLVILTRALSQEALDRWGSRNNVLVATESSSSLYGEVGAGHETMWDFSWLAREVG